jgi:hypothetical protein
VQSGFLHVPRRQWLVVRVDDRVVLGVSFVAALLDPVGVSGQIR